MVTAEGSQFVQVTAPIEVAKPVLVGWRLRELGNDNHALDLIVNRAVSTTVFIGAPSAFDGLAVAAAGYWGGLVVDPQRLEAALITLDVLTDAEIAAWDDAHPVVAPPNGANGNGNGGGNGGNGNGTATAVAAAIPCARSSRSTPACTRSRSPSHPTRRRMSGMAQAPGSTRSRARSAVFDRVKQHRAKLDRIGMHVLRIFRRRLQGRLRCGLQAVFRPVQAAAGGGERVRLSQWWAGAEQHPCARRGREILLGSRPTDPHRDQSKRTRRQPRQQAADGSYADHQRWLREDLDSLGLQRVKVAALEWRHPPNGGIPEFDQLKAAGLIGKDKAVEIGCGHVYDKVQGLDLADRLRSVGCTWSSWETGNNGTGAALWHARSALQI